VSPLAEHELSDIYCIS